MKGNNELRINQETMIEAMQFYISEKLKLEKMFVSEVAKDERDYTCDHFIVRLTEEEPKP